MHDCSPAAATAASNADETIILFNEKVLFLELFIVSSAGRGLLLQMPLARAWRSWPRSEVTGEAAEGSSDASSLLTSSIIQQDEILQFILAK